MPWLINPTQLDKFRKNQKSLIILDATWFLPEHQRDAKKEFLENHIIGSQFLDLDQFNDPNTHLPNQLFLDEKVASEKLSSLGIRNDYKIIIYDNSPLHTSARALWMFKIFGHNPNQLYILDGGLTAWQKYNGKLESGEVSFSAKQYSAKLQLNSFRNLSQIKSNLQHPQEQLVDLRHPVRFSGGGETRPGLRSGHIPGSYCFPYFCFFDKEGNFLTLEQIKRHLIDIGLDLNTPIVSSCGSGMTSPILNFILDLMDHPHHAVYNGSWVEWGSENLYPGENDLSERPVESFI